MKSLSEFAEGLRKQEPRNYSSENADYYGGFDAGMARAADLLQAWLREADAELVFFNKGFELIKVTWIRHRLLGTTRQKDSPKKESSK